MKYSLKVVPQLILTLPSTLTWRIDQYAKVTFSELVGINKNFIESVVHKKRKYFSIFKFDF